MGFTPWPYDATTEAAVDTVAKIQEHGDVVSHHLMGGIPWQQAFDGDPLPANVVSDLDGRVAATASHQRVFLSVDSLSSSRDQLVGEWNASGDNQPRSGAWATRSFADAAVIDAFVAFALDVIERFDPAWFNYGAEASELLLNDPEAWADYLVFAEAIYTRIKEEHPGLPLMITVALKHPESEEMREVREALEDVAPYVDMFGISTYGYAFYGHADAGDPDNLPEAWLTQAESFPGDKPLAITETGWIAEDLRVDAFGLSVAADADAQDAYVARLFEEAEAIDAAFVVWFSVVDYDALWSGVLAENDVAAIWRDTGLYDETLAPRPALTTWDRWFVRPLE